MLDTRRQFDDFEYFLLLFDLQRHVRGHGVDQATGLIDAVERGQYFGRNLLAQLHVLLELAQQGAHEHFRLAIRSVDLVDQLHFGTHVAVDLQELLDTAALLAFDQHLDSAIGQFEQLQDGGDSADTVQGVFTWIVIGGILLREQKDLLFARHRRLEGFDGLLTTHKQRDNHVRIDDDIAQWQERQFDGCLHDFASTAAPKAVNRWN